MAQQNQDGQTDGLNGMGKDKRSGEPLFGPSIGAVSNGPAWTLSSEKKVVTDELTQDIVNLWIEKSKEVSPAGPLAPRLIITNLCMECMWPAPIHSSAIILVSFSSSSCSLLNRQQRCKPSLI